MGLFNLFKKKPQQPQHNEELSDFNPLDINSVIGYIKENKPDATEQDVVNIISKLAEPDEDQEHLTPDGDLPWGWFSVHKDFTDRISSEYKYFLNSWLESRKLSPHEEYTALKSFVIYMNDAKVLCGEKGECFLYWLESLFDDSYLLKQTSRLKKLEEKLNDA